MDRETARPAHIPPLRAGDPGSYEYVVDPLGLYGTVAKITVTNESPGRCELRPYEISPAGPATAGVFGEQWCWFSFMVPQDWIIDYPRGADVDANYLVPHGRELILQYHESPDVGDTAHYPSLQMFIYGERIAFALTYDTAASTTLRAPNIRVLGTWSLDRGRWQSWVVRLKIAYNTSGILEIYREGFKVFSETGVPTFYNDTLGGYFKGGLYRYFDSQAPAKREIYHRGFVLGDANSSLYEVSGLLPRNQVFSGSFV
jgi:hypothetical protein